MLNISDKELYTLSNKAVRNNADKLFAGFFGADDLQQLAIDVFAKAWENRDKYDENRGTPANWVWKIARNAVLDAYRAEKKYRSLFSPVALREYVDDDGDAVGFTPIADVETDALLIAKETRQVLRSCVPNDEDKRLYDGLSAGLTSADLAERKGVPAKKMYTPVSRLRTNLRDHLDLVA